jgi:hypothetical protein
MLFNRDKIILDLCGGTGSWSRPYQDAGYDVRLVSYPDNDVRVYEPPAQVYGILAAPPCTHFSIACNRLWDEKDADGRTMNDLAIVSACCRIIVATNPKFWVLENPVGRLKNWLGKPVMSFNPYDYGDPYSKKTLLWGSFNWPYKTNKIEEPESEKGHNKGWIYKYGGSSKATKTARSITPPGFAKAFFTANN